MGKSETAYTNPGRADTGFNVVIKNETSHVAPTKVESDYATNPNRPTPDIYNDATRTYNDSDTYYIGILSTIKNTTKVDTSTVKTAKTDTDFSGTIKSETIYT
jgi:hypothetical protein